MQELSLSSSHVQGPFARLGHSHGYRIDGDSALLNAEIDFPATGHAASALALQLWACEEPYHGGALAGFKVAETRVVAPAEEPSFSHGGASFARPPAVSGDYAMVLVLASDEGARAVLDFANYPQRQRFVVPQFDQELRLERVASGVRVAGARVFNPRAADNLSGSLCLQLWSTRVPFAGGEPQGTLLGSTLLGQLAGQSATEAGEFVFTLSAEEAQSALTLALCEWTAEGYLVRDFRNFDAAQPVLARASGVTAREPAPEPVKRAEVASEVKQKPSLNRIDADELVALAGIQKKLAKELIKARPFRSFDEVLAVRGVGDKILQKLRGLLTL